MRLAADSAADEGEMQEITERLFSTIAQIAEGAHGLSARVENIAQSAEHMRHALVEAARSAEKTVRAR